MNKSEKRDERKKGKSSFKIIVVLFFAIIILFFIFKQKDNIIENGHFEKIITETIANKKEDIDLNKTVYLTFDDGPTEWTKKILEVLNKYNIKATFFITNPKGKEEIVKTAYEEGHKIGVHSYSHSYSEIYKNRESFWNDIEKVQKEIQNITGVKTDIMRFAGGSKNTLAIGDEENILSKLKKEVKSKGYEYFDWNVSAGDGGGALTDIDYITNNMIEGIKKNKTSIVLCHDTYENLIYGIENVIKWCNENDYKFRVINKEEFVYHY